MIDGDPQWGAPVSVDLTGLTDNDTYTVSFYQAATEETSNPEIAYDDNWEAYLLPTSDTSGVYICPQAYCTDNSGTKIAAPAGSSLYQSPEMDDTAGGSTAWELESFTFVATATSQVLEFVTNVESSTGTVLGAGTTFQPPMLGLADVTLTSVAPEPGTWALTILGVGFVFAGSRLRRRFSRRG
jgi:hypothetical protein